MRKFVKLFIFSLIVVSLVGWTIHSVDAQTPEKKDQKVKVGYAKVRGQYLKELNFWKNARENFLKARGKFRKLKRAEDKSLYLEKAKAFLQKTVEVLIKRMEALKNWIVNKKSLSERAKKEILSEIEKEITWLQNKEKEISEGSLSDIKEIAKQIRQYWRNHRLRVKKVIGRIMLARLDWVIKRFENVASKVSQKITELKEKGKDTTQLENWLADFQEKIDLAKQKRDEAREKYETISNLSEANKFIVEVNKLVRKAHQYLREAHKQLIEIIREMRRMIKGE